MTRTTRQNGRQLERGNAVTLTLLGLAVAILAGVVVLYYIGKSIPQPIHPSGSPEEHTAATTTPTGQDPRAGWHTYTNEMYDFSIQFPQGWAVATGTLFGDPAISIYLVGAATSTPPFSHMDVGVPHVSIYPHGLSTEGLFTDSYASTVVVKVPQASARDYRVTNGRPWATQAVFEQHPASWTDSGFVFTSARIEELEFGCMRGTVDIDIGACDPFTGDRTVIHGFVDTAVRDAEEEMLRSFTFTTPTQEGDRAAEAAIRVSEPQPDAVVQSPLMIQGEARGTWYFEGDFPVRLETDAGEVLANVTATALDDWMTEDFVPFEVSLAFGSTTATSGRLVLEKDDPSGLPKHAASMTIPLRFTK